MENINEMQEKLITDTTELTFEYIERFERAILVMDQIGDYIKSSNQRPLIDDAIWNEFGAMEQDICSIEERLFDILVKIYQLNKGKYEIKNIGICGNTPYIMPIKS